MNPMNPTDPTQSPGAQPEYPEYITLEQAREVAARVNQTGIGGGIVPETNDPRTSGIFLPDYGIMPTNTVGERKMYHFRFANGNSQIVAGLVLMTMKTFPVTWPAILQQGVQPQPKFPWDM